MKNFTRLSVLLIAMMCCCVQQATSKEIKVTSTNPAVGEEESVEGDFYWALQQMEDGDTIVFDELLRGDTIRYSGTLTKVFTGNVSIQGNGIYIINDQPSNSVTNALKIYNGNWEISDIVFGENCMLIASSANSIKFNRCVFEDIVDITEESWVATEEGEKRFVFESCRFSNKKEQYLHSPLTVSNLGMNNIQQYVDIISCTFTDFAEMGEAAVSADDASTVISGSGYSILGMELSPEPIVTMINSVITDIPQSPYGYPVIKVTNRLNLVGYNLIDGRIVCDNTSQTETDIVSDDLGELLRIENGEYAVLMEGKAYRNFPANTTIEGITMPEKDILGNEIDYSQPVHTGASQAVYQYVAVTGVRFEAEEQTLAIDKELLLQAIIEPSDATIQEVSWSSSNEEVATVDENGLVTAITAGETIITATTEEGGFTAECKLKVVVPVEGIALNENTLTLDVEDTFTLTVAFTPENATEKGVIWTSSDSDIVSVDEEGTITAISEGTATITVESTDGGFIAECIVTVNDPLSIAGDKSQATSIFSRGGEFVFRNLNGYRFTIYSVSGQALKEIEVNGSEFTFHPALPAGVYVLKGNSDNGTLTAKVGLQY